MRVNVARNWDEFLDALKRYQTPTQNIAYADVDGDIGFVSPGLLPTRKSGDGLPPVDGASGAADWTGVMPSSRRRRSITPTPASSSTPTMRSSAPTRPPNTGAIGKKRSAPAASNSSSTPTRS